MPLRIEAIENELAPGCPCCGEGGLRGFVYDGEEPHSVYFAESGGMGAKPVVLIGIATGRWASDAPVDERACFVFACSRGEAGLEVKPTIPYLLAFPEFKQLGLGVEPEAADSHPMFARGRATLDVIIDQESRLAHLRSGRSRFSAN
jgi:hypothetical protein